MLDIYAIEELRNKNVPATDDSSKYKYASGENGSYGQLFGPLDPPGRRACSRADALARL